MKKIESNIRRPLLTGIGSLPHSYVDSALAYSFRHSIPFLPQIPIRNSKEYMIFQALDGLPGLKENSKGEPTLDLTEWSNKTHLLKQKLSLFFKEVPMMSTEFQPNPEVYSSWRPFLFECEEQKIQYAKIQIAGPLTSQWALKVMDGPKKVKTEEIPELSNQIFQLVLAKSLSMSRALKGRGVTPLFYFDEPGLYVFDQTNPYHGLNLKELELCIRTLQKENITVGLHCCSKPDWKSIFSLNLDIISFDTHIAFDSLLTHGELLKKYIQQNSFFSFGIIPTTFDDTHPFTKETLSSNKNKIKQGLIQVTGLTEIEIKEFLNNCLYTAACGLTYQNIKESEETFFLLESVLN